MLLDINPIYLLILAGLINGSFVIPSRYVKNANNDQIWLFYTIIGLSILPWILLFYVMPEAYYGYASEQPKLLLFIGISGIIFGFGQIWFAQAIGLVGVALSFAINLGIGLIIGSMFVVFYESAFLTEKGFLVIFSIFLILSSLIIYYFAGKNQPTFENNSYKKEYTKGCILASLTGITSGLQNISFIMVTSY